MYDEYGNVMMCEGEPISATANQQGGQLMYLYLAHIEGGARGDDELRRVAWEAVTGNSCMGAIHWAAQYCGVGSIEEAYQVFLCREPDAGGLAYYSQLEMPECGGSYLDGKTFGELFYGSIEACERVRRIENARTSILNSAELAGNCDYIQNYD